MNNLGDAFFALLENAAILLAIVAIFELSPMRRPGTWPRLREGLLGVGLGSIGLVLMTNPWLYVPGVIFDMRSVLLGISGLFFGVFPTCIAMAMTALYRLSQGGAATQTGIMVILCSGTIGLLWRHRRAEGLETLSWGEIYTFGILVHVVMLAMMLYLPLDLALQTLRDITLPVLIIYPAITTLVGMLMVSRARRAVQLQEIEANEERLRLALAAGDLGTFDLNVQSGEMNTNSAYTEMLGVSPRTHDSSVESWVEQVHPEDKPWVAIAYEDHLAGRRPEFREEIRLVTGRGETIWGLLLGKVVAWDTRGRALRMLGTITDITSRRKAEIALRESEFQLRELIAHSFSAIVLLRTVEDADGQLVDFLITDANAATERHGRTPVRSLVGQVWSQADAESFGSQAFEYLVQVVTSGQPAEWEEQVPASQRTLHVTAYRIGAKQIAAVFEDITDRKRAEEALEREASRRRILVEQAEDGIVVIDDSRRVVEANRSFADMLGVSMDEALTLHPWDWDTNLPTPDKLKERCPESSRTPMLMETQWRRRDGSLLDVEVSCNPVEWGGQQFHFDVCRNITARKRAEQVLRLQAAALGAAANAIVITDRGGTMEWVNKAWCDLTGYSFEEAIGQNSRLLKSGMHNDAFYRELWTTILSGRVWQSEVINRRKDGTLYIEEEIIAPVLGEDGAPTNFVGIKQDITKRKHDEETLRESEERFRRAMANAPFPTMLHAEDGTVLEVSRSWCEITGYTPQEMATISQWTALAFGEQKSAMDESIRHLYGQHHASQDGVHDIRIRSGDVRIWEFGSAPLGRLPDGRRLVLSMAMDVTDQRRAEAERERLQYQLQQVQRMESVGRLAGGVAHDFNNMISAILGNAELVLSDLPPEDPLHEHLDEIVRAAQRSADLTRQLLAFARRQVARPQVLNLNDVIANMLKMLQRLIGEDIDLTWKPGPDLWPVNMDPSQLDQILANLVVNARDAIAGVGKMTIETANVELDDLYAAQHAGFVPGDFVTLTVTDNGAGMDRDMVAQIFEPFFTTKQLHQGTGLGLATVYGIVKQNEGFINVYSELGTGSSFKVYLPRTLQPATSGPMADAPVNIVGGAESLLVVEDESAIRNVIERVLTNFGYEVILAASPEEALSIIQDPKVSLHMLITDVVLPGMNGKDLAQRVLAIRPDLRVLYMSGYTANVIAHHGVLNSEVDFLQKPFSIAGLTNKVREVLDRTPARTPA